jgi:hypothetical protein
MTDTDITMDRRQRWRMQNKEKCNQIARDYYHNNPEQKQKRKERNHAYYLKKKAEAQMT